MNELPLRHSNRSIYFSSIFEVISSGNAGGGLFLSQSVVPSKSRTNCLSKEGWLLPDSHGSAGQKRELFGGSTSSIAEFIRHVSSNLLDHKFERDIFVMFRLGLGRWREDRFIKSGQFSKATRSLNSANGVSR